MQFAAITDSVVSDVVPAVGILKVGFAFKDDEQSIAALDGKLGDYIDREIAAKGIVPLTPKACIIGKRAISNNTRAVTVAGDIAGLEARVPPSRIGVDHVRGLGATPVSISFAETYTALQTRLVDGTELPPAVVDAGRLYEVQRYLSITNHGWGGWYLISNPDAWKALLLDVQRIVTRLASEAVIYSDGISSCKRPRCLTSFTAPEEWSSTPPPICRRSGTDLAPTTRVGRQNSGQPSQVLEQYSGNKLG